MMEHGVDNLTMGSLTEPPKIWGFTSQPPFVGFCWELHFVVCQVPWTSWTLALQQVFVFCVWRGLISASPYPKSNHPKDHKISSSAPGLWAKLRELSAQPFVGHGLPSSNSQALGSPQGAGVGSLTWDGRGCWDFWLCLDVHPSSWVGTHPSDIWMI